jgi:hypothetical protein
MLKNILVSSRRAHRSRPGVSIPFLSPTTIRIGERRMEDGASEYWSVGGLENWRIGLGAKQIGYAYWLRAN